MAGNRIICTANQVDYITIRKAMIAGARSVDEIKEGAGVCVKCEGCADSLEDILLSVCGCKKVSLADVVAAVKAGAGTVEKVGEITGAGTDCGRCKALIQNVIDIGR